MRARVISPLILSMFGSVGAIAQTYPIAISGNNLKQSYGVAGHLAGVDASGNLQPPSNSTRGGVTSVTGSNVVVTGVPTSGTPTVTQFIGTTSGTARDAAAAIAAEGAASSAAAAAQATANAALPTSSAGPLATQAGSTASAAIGNALGYTPVSTTQAVTIPWGNGWDFVGTTAPTPAQVAGALTLPQIGGEALPAQLPETASDALGAVNLSHQYNWTNLQQLSGGLAVNLDPNQAVCPAANCPTPANGTGNEVMTASLLSGQTTLDSNHSEWLGVDSLYVNTGQPNGQKVVRYEGAVQGPLGGTTWGLNTDVVRNGIPNGPDGQVGSSSPGTPGAIPDADGTVGAELDFTNWNWDAAPGHAFTTDLYIHNQSRFASLAGIYFDSSSQDNYGANTFTAATWSSGNLTLTTSTAHGVIAGDFVTLTGFSPASINGTYMAETGTTGSTIVVPIATDPGTVATLGALSPYSNFAWHDGILINGSTVVDDNAFVDSTNASYGFSALGGTTGIADFYADDSRRYGFVSGGNHTTAEFWATGSAPTGIQLDGAHSNSDIVDTGSGGQNGLAIQGTHTQADINLESPTPKALLISGSRSTEDIDDSGTGPAGLAENGTHSLADIFDNSSSSTAIAVAGTHTSSVIDSRSSTTPSLFLAAAGQQGCYNGTSSCWAYAAGTGLEYKVSGTAVATIADSGAVISPSDGTTVTVAATSGGTSSLSQTSRYLLLTSSAALNSYTIDLDPSPIDGELNTFCISQSITSLTISSQYFIIGNESSMSVPCYNFRYFSGNHYWVRVS